MKKVFRVGVILSTIAMLISIGMWRHYPLNSPADVPQRQQRVQTATSGTTSKSKPRKVVHLQDKAAEKHSENLHPWTRASQPVSEGFQENEFYRTIIDNNLFRPLGWKPSVPPPTYRLLGTIMPSEGKTHPQAIIEAIVGNKTHIVGIGDILVSDIKIVDIQPKQVTLDKAGQRITLKLAPSTWLKVKRSRTHRR